MRAKELTKEQKEELEQFGANTWFVEYLHKEYQDNPSAIPAQWQNFFEDSDKDERVNGKNEKSSVLAFDNIKMPEPSKEDQVQVIAGSSARILENMTSSLSVPTATSQRTIPVKLLEENRMLINEQLKKRSGKKISFTHIIAWAVINAVKEISSMNNSFTVINGKPHLIKRGSINLGLAIDLERKDGSRSLIVPNIKDCGSKSFNEFFVAYEDLVKRSRKGLIDPAEFLGTTISLTNPGTIGTVVSVPRLMIGQGTIVATGAIQYPAEFSAMSPATISSLGVSKIMNVTSTYDHRIIQGAESGLFLKKINDLLLGESEFYEEIFSSMEIPLIPLVWKTDYHPGGFAQNGSSTEEIEKQARILQLINMYRVRGHLIANLDPLDHKGYYHPELDPASYGLTIWDYDREFIAGGYSGIRTATLREILDTLQKTYCEKIGTEYMHIQNPDEKAWMQSRMEPVKNKPSFDVELKKRILKKLIMAESFEHFIHNRFIGHKRFSVEGSETIIPVLDYLLDLAGSQNVTEVVLGMAHRGRLNVLANIIGKSYESIFSEFEDIKDPESKEGSGDVKYHLGASGDYKTFSGNNINISVASNPSHLEWVNPVVQGIVRAKQTRSNDLERSCIMPLLIHGDAAFAGQGVVAETLNLSQLKGYRTGGTIHIIINNQIGFTTDPKHARSSEYATDVAKMIQAPIFHVNGDDPEASLWVTKLAFEYRQKFKKDVVIDLFGYRRHGHNEGDEPGFTQPILYEKIKNHASVKEIYSKFLIENKFISEDEVSKMTDDVINELSEAFDKIKKKKIEFGTDVPLAVPQESVEAVEITEETCIDEQMLKLVIEGITTVPEGFRVHPKLQKFLEKRREFISGNLSADWAFAEAIAFGSLLVEGNPVRLSGQDSRRGTFSQRHLVFTDIHNGNEYLITDNITDSQAQMETLDSLLSEAAVLGFEYGYSTADPLALVIWEAQFGDFANSAQVIVDNFIVSSYEKWKVPNSVVMLLPHGYEGQGPEHSSARLERFLILSAQNNMHVCNVTTPAQYFHLLRRQIRHNIQKPLVIMTPKSLLRLPEAKSPKEEFLSGRFHEILDDPSVEKKKFIERVLFTSGKVYFDLAKFRKDNNLDETAIVRLEQFYPYDGEKISEVLSSYTNAKKIVWVQEEPKNMGGWTFISSRLWEDLSLDKKLYYAGRPEQASPAVGSSKLSNQQQKELIEKAFKL
jgi:multifunctional 2-oxoglutarate metabolism enzyme